MTTTTNESLTILQQAIEQAKIATDLDSKQQLMKAYSVYLKAIELFCLAIRDEKTVNRKKHINLKTVQIIRRAEEIKESLNTQIESDPNEFWSPTPVKTNEYIAKENVFLFTNVKNCILKIYQDRLKPVPKITVVKEMKKKYKIDLFVIKSNVMFKIFDFLEFGFIYSTMNLINNKFYKFVNCQVMMQKICEKESTYLTLRKGLVEIYVKKNKKWKEVLIYLYKMKKDYMNSIQNDPDVLKGCEEALKDISSNKVVYKFYTNKVSETKNYKCEKLGNSEINIILEKIEPEKQSHKKGYNLTMKLLLLKKCGYSFMNDLNVKKLVN